MELILNAASIVVSIFLMMALGFIGAKKGWFGENARPLFSFLVVRVGLPCMILYNVTTNYTRESLAQGAFGLLVPFLSMSAVWLLAMLLHKLLRIDEKRKGVFLCMCAFSNSVFIGVPISTAIFGEAVLPDTLLYYIANTLIFWTIGVFTLRQDGGEKQPLFSKATLKNLFSVPLTTFLISVVIVLLGFQLPKPILDACKYLGNIVTPLSMLFIGTVLAGIQFRNLKIDRGQIAVVVCRFVLSPLLVWAISLLIPLGTTTRDVFLVQASMPVMTQVSLLSATYGGDVEYATVGTTLTTLLSLVMIPVMAILLPYI